MATSSRDVTLTLSVDTLGEDGIKQLQTAVAALAKEGGNAGPEFAELANQLSRLGDQNAALQSFKELADTTETLRAKQEATATTAVEMAARLETLRTTTAATTAKQREAAQELLTGQKAYTEAGNAIRILKTEYDSAGKNTAEFRSKLNALTVTQAEAKTALIELRAAQKDANAEATKADSALTKLEGQYVRQSAAVDKSAEALRKQERVLSDAAATAQALGVSTADVASAQGALVAAFNQGVTAVNARSASVKEMAEADRLLAIEEQGLIELLRRGEQALQAETLAQRDAARSIAEYEAAKNAALTAGAEWQKEAEGIVNAAEAAQKLARESEKLTAAQKELAAQRAFEQQASDAQKLVQAGEYVRFWETALQQAETQVKQTAASASVAADQIDNAFRTVGVRSAEELQTEIAQVRAAMNTLATVSASTGNTMKGAFAAGEAKLAGLERDLRELNGTLTLGDKAARLFSNSMGQITAGNIIADGVGYLVNKVKELGVEFVTVNLESQRLTKALTQIYGSAAAAGQQFEFLRGVTDKSGISIRDVSDGFLRFSAAAQTSGVSLQTANGVFAEVSNAAGVLGLKGEQVTGVLEALGQIASKGTVSLEELRGQLGDRLPGAMAIAAKGLGVTQAELVKMVESGSVASNVFFPAFEKGLRETFGSGTAQVEGFIQGWNRLLNAIVKTAQKASETTVFTNLGKAFDFVAVNIDTVVKAVELLAARFAILKIAEMATSFIGLGNAATKSAADIAVKTAAVTADTAATGANTVATAANSVAKSQNAAAWGSLGTALATGTNAVRTGTAAVEASTVASRAATVAKTGLAGAVGLLGAASSKLVGFLGGPIGALLTFGLFAKDLGAAIGETTAKMFGWGKVLEDNEKKIEALAAKEKAAADARRAAAVEQDIINSKASAASALAVKQAEQAVLSSEAEVKAKQQKVAATKDLIGLQGEEQAGLDAIAQASADVVTAAEKELLAKEQLSKAAENQIAAIKLTVGANGELTKSQQEQIAKLEEMSKARASEVEKQQETIRQLAIEAASRKIAAESLKDNSGRVTELSAAYENAKAKLDILEKSGTASLGQLSAAQIEVAASARLMNDAYKDATSKIELKAKAESASVGITLSASNAGKLHYETLAKQSEAQGDYAMATYYTIEAKKQERAAAEASIKIKQIELNTEKEKINLEIESIKGTDAASLAKKEELRIRLEVIKAKQIDLNASKETIKALDDEIRALINGTNAKNDNRRASDEAGKSLNAERRARDANTAAIEAENASLERANAAKEKAIELENKRRAVDKDGFSTGKDGNRIVAGGDLNTRTGIFNFLKSAGVSDDAEARRITSEFSDSQGNIPYMGNPGQMKYGGDTLSMALLKAAEQFTFSDRSRGGSTGGNGYGGSAGNSGRMERGSSPSDASTTVNINLNGSTTAVRTDAAGAAALQKLLSSLGAASRTASWP